MEYTEMKPVLVQLLDGDPNTDKEQMSPSKVLAIDNSKKLYKDDVQNIDEDQIDKLYQENLHYLNSMGTPIDDDPIGSVDKDNIDHQVDKLYKENEHYLSSMMYSGHFLNQIPNKELIEMNEQVDSYMLQEKVYKKVCGSENQDYDDKSLLSTDNRTDIGSVRGFLGNKVSQRHYYMLIQNNNTLLNDAQQFRSRLVEKLSAIENQLVELQTSTEDSSTKSTFVKRFFTYRKEYFIDEDLFPCPGNSEKRKLEIMNVIPTYVPHGIRWIMSHMEKLKKEVASHIMLKKSAVLKKMKTQISRSKPNTKMQEDYSKLEKEMEMLHSLSEENISMLVKDVSIDWEQVAMRVRPESIESANKTDDDCRRMWQLCLAPSVNQKPWSEEEDLKLEHLAIQNNGEDWDTIAEQLGTKRTGFQCFTHYQLKFQHDSNIAWTKREEILLLSHISKHKHTTLKTTTLMAIALHLPKRSFGEVRRRLNQLKESTTTSKACKKKGPFTEWEVRVIETCIKQGLNFKTIANLLGNRTHAQVRDKMSRKYDTRLPQNQKRKGLFTNEEDRKLMSLTVRYGIKSWSFIAKKMKSRDRTQCRHRYNTICANIKMGHEYKQKISKPVQPAASTSTCENEREALDSMMDLIKQEPLASRSYKKSSGRRVDQLKLYQKKYQNHSDVDDLIQDYFAYVSHVPRCTSSAIRGESMEKFFTGDALQATLNYLQMEPDPELLHTKPEVTHEEVSEYWNMADYPHMIQWYQNNVKEQEKMRLLNQHCVDEERPEETTCQDIDLELPFCYLSNRYTINSMLDSDISFYKSNLVYEPIRSKSTHARLVVNNNGASTCNTSNGSSSRADSRDQYFFPPSVTTLKALENYKKFQANTVRKFEVWYDYDEQPNVRETKAGIDAKALFQTRLQNLFTASYLLVQPISEKTEISPNLDWIMEDEEAVTLPDDSTDPNV